MIFRDRFLVLGIEVNIGLLIEVAFGCLLYNDLSILPGTVVPTVAPVLVPPVLVKVLLFFAALRFTA